MIDRVRMLVWIGCLLFATGAAVPAAGEIAAAKSKWKSLETPSFRVIGEVTSRRVAETAERLELFRAALARLKPNLPARPGVPTLVVAFSNSRTVDPYLILEREDAEDYSAVFYPRRWGNYLIFDSTSGDDPLDTVYSGYVHFFVSSYFPKTPLWMESGLAEYYETFQVSSGGLEIGRPSEASLERLRRGWRIPLARLMAIDRDSPEYLDRDEFGYYVAHCWALVHALLIGEEGMAAKVPDLLARLDRGEVPEAAVPAALGIELAELESRLRHYTQRKLYRFQQWRLTDLERPRPAEPSDLAPAEALTLLAEFLAHAGAAAPAREHLAAAEAAGGETGDTLALRGFLAEEAGELAAADDLYRRALAAPMRRAISAVHAAERARERSDWATARTAVDRALELDPDFGEAWAIKGRIELGAGEPAAALAALAEAERRLPARVDVVHNRYLAALRAGQLTVARGIAAGPLARLDREQAAQAMRELAEQQQHDATRAAFEEADRALAEQRWDDALRILREAQAQLAGGAMTSVVDERLRQVEGFVAEQRRIEAYNRAVALGGERRYAEAAEVLRSLLADCGEDAVCGTARDLLRQLEQLTKPRR